MSWWVLAHALTRMQVRHASASLRELLSEDAEGKKKAMVLPTLSAPTMRFSRRQRGMEINQDLAAEQELVMQEAHTAQHRWAPALVCSGCTFPAQVLWSERRQWSEMLLWLAQAALERVSGVY